MIFASDVFSINLTDFSTSSGVVKKSIKQFSNFFWLVWKTKKNLAYISDHPCRIYIIFGLGSAKTNVVLKLIKYQWPDIDKTYFFVKDPLESKYQFEKVRFQQKRIYEKVGIKGIKVGIKHEWKSKDIYWLFPENLWPLSKCRI